MMWLDSLGGLHYCPLLLTGSNTFCGSFLIQFDGGQKWFVFSLSLSDFSLLFLWYGGAVFFFFLILCLSWIFLDMVLWGVRSSIFLFLCPAFHDPFFTWFQVREEQHFILFSFYVFPGSFLIWLYEVAILYSFLILCLTFHNSFFAYGSLRSNDLFFSHGPALLYGSTASLRLQLLLSLRSHNPFLGMVHRLPQSLLSYPFQLAVFLPWCLPQLVCIFALPRKSVFKSALISVIYHCPAKPFPGCQWLGFVSRYTRVSLMEVRHFFFNIADPVFVCFILYSVIMNCRD